MKPFPTLALKRRAVLAAPALMLPKRARAWTHGKSSGGGYHASAVHFDGVATLMRSAGIIASDGHTGTCSFWFNAEGNFAAIGRDYLLGNDAQINGPNFVGMLLNFAQQGTPTHALLSLIVSDSIGQGANQDNVVWDLGLSSVVGLGWHNIIISWNTNFGAGSRLYSAYLDDVELSLAPPPAQNTQVGSAFLINYSASGNPTDTTFIALASNEDTPTTAGDFAEVFFAVNSIVQSDGTILTADRRKYISASGKPVDPSGLPSQVVYLSGNASTFAINQGTGGAFTLTGALTNASTSPSD